MATNFLFDPWEFWRMFYQNTQNILTSNSGNTTTINNFAGNKAIEEAVVSSVASYGSQLGWLSEIALELAKKSGLKTKEVDQLSRATENITKIKKAINASARSRAADALETLKKENPDEFQSVIQEYAASLPSNRRRKPVAKAS
jgi:DnaJ-domain-containing protein 1